MPPALPPAYTEDLDRRTENVLKRRPTCMQQSSASTAQSSQSKPPENMSQPRPSEIPPSPNPPLCAEPNLLGDDQIESEVNSLKALADNITGNWARRSPNVHLLRSNHHHHELVRVWKHPNSHASCAGRYNQQPSMAVGTLMLEACSSISLRAVFGV